MIKDTTDNKNIYINNREPINSHIVITPDSITGNKEDNIIISLKDEEENSIPDQYVQVKVDEDTQTYITDNDGKITIPVN